ncbi:uncharacterized protein VTP21DRAFT_2561 [Calcarisporiella thermophila]|uniref:uncharacterized protein n=1 Tax=Calcarisporiella thermophila TaxID=911321 RepID=UPI0037442EDB
MLLEGSCHCGKIAFTCESSTPYPYMICYCSICRKTQGGSGGCINIRAERETFKLVRGAQYLKVYHAIRNREDPVEKQELCGNLRYFCSECASYLWADDPQWFDSIYPYASAFDTELPVPPHRVHLLLSSGQKWADPRSLTKAKEASGHEDQYFEKYPDLSIVDWHKKYANLSK